MWAWLASRSCAGPGPFAASQSSALEWSIYILFSPCGLRILQASIHIFFFAILSVFLLARGRKSQHQESRSRQAAVAGPLFIATLSLTALIALLSIVSFAWHIWYACSSSGGSWVSIAEALFAGVQASAWTTFTVVVGHELSKHSTERSRPLRAWWFAISLLSVLQFSSAVARVVGYGFTYSLPLEIDDILSIIIFPVSTLLMVISVRGQTGLLQRTSDGLTRPLLEAGDDDGVKDIKVTAYSSASLLSRAFWIWLSPVLSMGASTTLQINDIPELAPEDRAERLYALLQSNWPGDQSKHPTLMAIITSFKWQFALNAFLAFCRAISMYVGPALITSFSTFLESSPRPYSEGCLLVFILLVSKLVEVLATHHYQFLSGKLGMTIRSSLITSVYRKGLKLSSASRQAHGTGQIVNYMSVDVQQINDSVVQLNNTWMLPLQVIIALLILYQAIGLAAFAGLATMILFGAIITQNSSLLKKFSMQLMMKKDIRMKATTEVLSYMKIIKLQAWEDYFQKKVEASRLEEYKSLAKFHAALAFNISVVSVSTSVVAVISFWVCLLLDSNFTAAKAFTVISTFNILSEPVRTFPQAIIALSQAFISLKRLDKYFLSGELAGYVKRDGPISEPDHSIIVKNGHFTWDEDQPTPILQDINVKVKQGHLVAIVGTVGAGKSSLLAALLGEMPKLKGDVEVVGTTAYVPQTSWIQSGTVQENILFGLALDHAKYRRTVKACALEQDFAMFEFGDQTEIGERGINLSGGQKQRIQLARAVYQDSDIYLLDDVFSAVDAHTGSALFEDCLLGILRNKTRVLVTHQVEFLHKVDRILVVQNGKIEQSGTYADLLKAGAEFGALVAAHKKAIGEVDEPVDEVQMEEFSVGSPPSLAVDRYDDTVKLMRRLSSASRSQERLTVRSRSSGSFSKANGKEEVGKLVEDEKRETGRVGWNVYWLYMTSAYGTWFIFLALGIQVVAQTFSVCADFWLSHETSQTSFNGVLLIAVYALLSAGNWIFSIARQVVMALFSLKSTQAFYLKMLRSIFRAPMSFFDTTPTGRILTRSSTDQATLDVMLPLALVLGLLLYSSTFGVVIVTCIVTWPIIFLVLPLVWVYIRYQAFYLRSSREIARLDSVTKAPVIHHFTETISGFMVIRGFRKEDQFISMNLDRVNTNLKMDFHSTAANDWLGCRLELIGSVVLCGAALMLVVLPSSFITPASAALSLSYGLSLNSVLAASVFFSCTVENKMVSVERIGQYIRLPTEAALTIEGSVPDADWPRWGNISIQHLKARYQPTMPLVLKGISLDIVGGQKIGVVGRTGSGKSTLIQVLFRIIEPSGGLILFDEVDITAVGLHDLRSKLGIIPQDPVLFEGTIRTNMDPLMAHTDDEIWEGLRKCQLAEIVQARPDKLDAIVSDNGENWSVGQRQLLCLGRALLKKSHILFLDEATASVDAQTDALLQTVIREEFLNSTVISIAHRIPTVMDCDKVMVLEAGLLKEYDSPARLRQDSSTLFAALVNEYTARSRS